jgi:hypothetical protein
MTDIAGPFVPAAGRIQEDRFKDRLKSRGNFGALDRIDRFFQRWIVYVGLEHCSIRTPRHNLLSKSDSRQRGVSRSADNPLMPTQFVAYPNQRGFIGRIECDIDADIFATAIP